MKCKISFLHSAIMSLNCSKIPNLAIMCCCWWWFFLYMSTCQNSWRDRQRDGVKEREGGRERVREREGQKD